MTLEHLDTFIAFAVVMLGVSMIITIFVQIASSLCGLRGTNLKWGLVEVLKVVHPEFERHAAAIADRVLKHSLISDSAFSSIEQSGRLGSALGWLVNKTPLLNRWRLGSTVRPEELVGILEKLGAAAPPGTPPANYTVEEAMHYIAAVARSTSGPEVKALAAQIRELAAALPAPAAGRVVQIEQLLQKFPITAKATVNDLRSWFNAGMDRVSQRFALHTRLWTVAFSVVLAFALHLDAFRLLRQISSDAETRAALLQSADSMTKQAAALQKLPATEKELPAGAPGVSASRFPAAYTDAAKALRSEPGLTAAAGKDLNTAPAFTSREEAVEWLQKTFAGVPDSEARSLLEKYQLNINNLLTTETEKLLDRASSVRFTLATGKFQLIPDPYHEWDLAPSWPRAIAHHYAFWQYFWPASNLHFWGIVFSASLLSLGAPFWFNALKTLSALRPAIANKQEKEQKQ